MHGNVARARIVLQLVEHTQARVIRKIDVEQDRVGMIGRGRNQSVVGRMRDDALEIHLVREVPQDRSEAHVIFHYEDEP